MTPGPNLNDLIATIRADAESDEPLAQLGVAVATVAELEEVADAALAHFVDQCRRAGKSWSEISKSLGVTKQAAHKRFQSPPSLDRFTMRARRVLPAAVAEAVRLRHNFVGTEHVLLALFNDADSLGAKVLIEAGVTHGAVEERVLAFAPRGAQPVDAPPFTPLATDCIAKSLSEALQLMHNYVGTEHILLAVSNERRGLAAQILNELGAAREQLRAKIIEKLAGIVITRAAP